MATVRVTSVASIGQAVRAASRLDPEVADAAYQRMRDYVGRELDGGSLHTEWLQVEIGARRDVVKVVFFVDVDGTLNIASLE